MEEQLVYESAPVIEQQQVFDPELTGILGTMGSAKSATLLIEHYNLTVDNDINVLLFKSALDDRTSELKIHSRTGMSAEANLIYKNTSIIDIVKSQKVLPKIVIVDEVQFLQLEQIEELRKLVDEHGIKVDAYGLKLNFRGVMFGEETGSIKRLLELCDKIIIKKSICSCGKVAQNVARYDPESEDWKILTEGPEIKIGGNEQYIPLCYKCFSSGFIPRISRIKIYETRIKNIILPESKSDSLKMSYISSKILEEKSQIRKENILKIEGELIQKRDELKRLKGEREFFLESNIPKKLEL